MDQPAHFCENCGSPLGVGASFCEACGAPVTGAAKIPQPPPGPSPAHIPPSNPPAFYQPAVPPPPPPSPGYSQPAQPPQPPAAYYQPPAPPGYYPPVQPPASKPRRGTPVWLIVGGVVVALLLCCGLVVLLGSLVGGANLLHQVPGLNQNLPSGTVVEETPNAADTSAPPIPLATQTPFSVAESTLTSQPAPNEPQATPALPAPQGQRMEFTDDLSTNDNGWTTQGGNTPPAQGYLISTYYILASKESGEVYVWIPKIDNDQYKVKDFEIEFYGIQWNGDGYYGLDFHYVDNQNYYQVAIKDGKFIIRKKISGQFTNLTQGGWVPTNSIYPSGPSKIKVICHGDVIRLEINGDLMAQLKDDSLPEGAVTLTAGVLPEALDGTTFEGRFAGFDVVWWK